MRVSVSTTKRGNCTFIGVDNITADDTIVLHLFDSLEIFEVDEVKSIYVETAESELRVRYMHDGFIREVQTGDNFYVIVKDGKFSIESRALALGSQLHIGEGCY